MNRWKRAVMSVIACAVGAEKAAGDVACLVAESSCQRCAVGAEKAAGDVACLVAESSCQRCSMEPKGFPVHKNTGILFAVPTACINFASPKSGEYGQ